VRRKAMEWGGRKITEGGEEAEVAKGREVRK
jgi:hypothetical protein